MRNKTVIRGISLLLAMVIVLTGCNHKMPTEELPTEPEIKASPVPEDTKNPNENKLEEATGLEYTLSWDGKTYAVSGIGSEKRTSFSIPSTYLGTTVTSIAASAFANCNDLTYIEIPNGVTKIGEWAFGYCENLRGIELPQSLEAIEASAFAKCNKLINIVIPKNVTRIKNNAFILCDEIRIFTEAKGKPVGWESEWQNCLVFWGGYWETIDGVPTPIIKEMEEATGLIIGWRYGQECSVLGIGTEFRNEFLIPATHQGETVTMVGKGCFKNYNNIKSVVLSENITKILDEAFYDCKNLQRIVLSKNLINIGDFVFYNCDLESIIIPQGVEIIGRGAFSGCPNLTIYSESSEKPKAWSNSWNSGNNQVFWKGQWKMINGVPTPNENA